MQYVLAIFIFVCFYLGFGIVLNQPLVQSYIFKFGKPFQISSFIATLALPVLITAGGTYALTAVALSGLLLGTYGRKIGLDLAKQDKR